MSSNEQLSEQLWLLAAEELSERDAAALTERLASDSDLQQQFQEIVLLHQELGKIETEAPSLRFSKNILDQLPEQQPGLIGSWLLPQRWWRLLGGMTVAFLGTLIVALQSVSPSAGSSPSNRLPNLSTYLPALSNEFYFLLLVVSGAMLSIGLIDRVLKKRMKY